MKKNLSIVLIIILLFCFALFNNTLITNTIINSSKLFFTKVFPNLFIFLILAKILINYNFPYYISKIFKSSYLYIFLLGFFSTTPTNVAIIKKMYDDKLIISKTATIYIMSSFFINPLFLFNILNSIFPIIISLKIIIISYITNIIIYFLFKTKQKVFPNKIKEDKLSNVVINNIKDSMIVFFNIYSMIVIFSLLSLLLPKNLITLQGILEVTNGLNYLITCNLNIIVKEILAIIYINFGGLCLLMQVKSIIKDTSIDFSNYILSRFYACLIAISLFLLTLFVI